MTRDPHTDHWTCCQFGPSPALFWGSFAPVSSRYLVPNSRTKRGESKDKINSRKEKRKERKEKRKNQIILPFFAPTSQSWVKSKWDERFLCFRTRLEAVKKDHWELPGLAGGCELHFLTRPRSDSINTANTPEVERKGRDTPWSAFLSSTRMIYLRKGIWRERREQILEIFPSLFLCQASGKIFSLTDNPREICRPGLNEGILKHLALFYFLTLRKKIKSTK